MANNLMNIDWVLPTIPSKQPKVVIDKFEDLETRVRQARELLNYMRRLERKLEALLGMSEKDLMTASADIKLSTTSTDNGSTTTAELFTGYTPNTACAKRLRDLTYGVLARALEMEIKNVAQDIEDLNVGAI